MPLKAIDKNIFQGELNPKKGFLAEIWEDFRPDIIIGHPTFHNADNIPKQLSSGIKGAINTFANMKIAFIVTDGTLTESSNDTSTIDSAIEGAQRAMRDIDDGQKGRIQVVATPYEGYADDRTPGKGSALKMIFDEMKDCSAQMLILLDGDLKNDMEQWQKVFFNVYKEHQKREKGKKFFITARYARHFVDASLTRFIVGPLTTLMGKYVPGGISGDIVLSNGAVGHERKAQWTEARRKYGTDISTTFDNLADPETIIYEVYLGAKLHDITDEAKLSVMPGEVIGAALERILYWEEKDNRITKLLKDGKLEKPVTWTSEATGIEFIDPGYTDAFNIDTKISSLIDKFPIFKKHIETVFGKQTVADLNQKVENMKYAQIEEDAAIEFLDVTSNQWIGFLHKAIAYVLKTKDIETTKLALNYLYTAAFLEFVKEKLEELGYKTITDVRKAQVALGVPVDKAETFYREQVDQAIDEMARAFFDDRKRILDYSAN